RPPEIAGRSRQLIEGGVHLFKNSTPARLAVRCGCRALPRCTTIRMTNERSGATYSSDDFRTRPESRCRLPLGFLVSRAAQQRNSRKQVGDSYAARGAAGFGADYGRQSLCDARFVSASRHTFVVRTV